MKRYFQTIAALAHKCLDVTLIISLRSEYKARYDDELIIESAVLKARGSIIRFGYRIMRAADGLLLCEGETVHVVVGGDMKRTRLPKKYEELLGAAASHSNGRQKADSFGNDKQRRGG